MKDCAIVELRRYALHPGARDRLIALFDREFVETQEAAGMRIIGQFRDLGAADSFVWLRGFADMEARKAALARFYEGPVWAAHRDEANGTMVNSDDVLLLRPAGRGTGVALDGMTRPRPGDRPSVGRHFALTVFHLRSPAEDGFLDIFLGKVLPPLSRQGARSIATLITEASPNTYPRLPVREGENVLVSIVRLERVEAMSRIRQLALGFDGLDVGDARDYLLGETAISHLLPTARSLLR